MRVRGEGMAGLRGERQLRARPPARCTDQKQIDALQRHPVEKTLPGMPVVPDEGVAMRADIHNITPAYNARARLAAGGRPWVHGRAVHAAAASTRPTDCKVQTVAKVVAQARSKLSRRGTSQCNLGRARTRHEDEAGRSYARRARALRVAKREVKMRRGAGYQALQQRIHSRHISDERWCCTACNASSREKRQGAC